MPGPTTCGQFRRRVAAAATARICKTAQRRLVPPPLPGSPNRKVRESASLHRRPSAFPRLTPFAVARRSSTERRRCRDPAANRVLTTRTQAIGPVAGPRSPGWQPGDSGCENHPAVHAASLNVISRFKPTSHGTRDEMQPGVPRLPPGAFCAVRACQAERMTGERATPFPRDRLAQRRGEMCETHPSRIRSTAAVARSSACPSRRPAAPARSRCHRRSGGFPGSRSTPG